MSAKPVPVTIPDDKFTSVVPELSCTILLTVGGSSSICANERILTLADDSVLKLRWSVKYPAFQSLNVLKG